MVKFIETTLMFDKDNNLVDFSSVIKFASSFNDIAAWYKSEQAAGEIAYDGETFILAPTPISTRIENLVHSENKLMLDIYVNYFNTTQKITKVMDIVEEDIML